MSNEMSLINSEGQELCFNGYKRIDTQLFYTTSESYQSTIMCRIVPVSGIAYIANLSFMPLQGLVQSLPSDMRHPLYL